MESQIEEIKNRLNVVDVVGSYIKLTKTGANYRGVCPFHSEKKPSFFVSPSRQMWKCFGCGAGSSIFDFVMKIEGVEFGDAMRILANKAGIELKRENPKLRTERQRLYEICELACSFFEKQLSSSAWGKEAKEYLLKRGIKEENIKKWRLGYSPDTWQGLSDFLVSRGYGREEILKAGLAVHPVRNEISNGVKSENLGRSYDRFRGRIIFPIFDLNSQPIGFGGRVFSTPGGSAPGGKDPNKETAKYINTPQTLLYDKSNVLYGLNQAKLAVRKNNQCVLTEGYTDTIMAHQAGFENTVSVSGTALTPRHLITLKRYSDNLLLAFDMDLAGDTATKRGINLAESAGFNLKIINRYSPPAGGQEKKLDPAEIILEDPKIWSEAVSGARAIMDYYFDSAFAAFSAPGGPASGGDKTTPENKKRIAQIILPAIKRLQNKIEQSYWVQKLAEKLGVREGAILEELKNIKDVFSYAPVAVIPEIKNEQKITTVEGRKKLIEDKIISLILKDPDKLDLIEDQHRNLFCERTRGFLEELKQTKGNEVAFASISQKEEYKDFFDTLALRAEVDYAEEPPGEVELCISQLKGIELRNSLNNMLSAIKSEVNEQKKEDLIKEFDKKARELHQDKTI